MPTHSQGNKFNGILEERNLRANATVPYLSATRSAAAYNTFNPPVMAKKNLDTLTKTALQDKANNLKGILYILIGLIVVYLGYYAYSLIAGTWNSTKTLSIVALLMLAVVTVTTSSSLRAVQAEILKRDREE